MTQKTCRLAIISILFSFSYIVVAQITIPPLPTPASNNAVASLRAGKHEQLYSFMGIGPKKT